MAKSILAAPAAPSQIADLVGRAFTAVLLSTGERDLASTVALGTKLMIELHRRGLRVSQEASAPG